LNASDHSDNNNDGDDIDPAFVRKHGPVDLVILKLYPGTKASGPGSDGWTLRQYSALKDDFAIGFYAADSTPSWEDAKAVIVTVLGLDPKAHPFAFDLFEFGFSDDFVKGEIAKAQADGVKVGNYRSRGSPYQQLGAEWRWVADTVFPAGETPIAFDLHQHNAIEGFGDQSLSPLTLDEFLALTTTSSTTKGEEEEVPQFTDEEAAAIRALIGKLGPHDDQLEGFAIGMEAATAGDPLPDPGGPFVKRGFNTKEEPGGR
jgi:hypothetical protein